MKSNSIKSLRKLWSELKKVHKYLFISVCMSSIIVAILESLVIFSFIPFISSLAGDDNKNDLVLPNFLNFFQFSQNASISYSFFIFIFIIFLSAFCRLSYIYLTTRTSAIIGSYLSKKTYNVLLHRPYLDQVSKDTGYVIQMISSNVTRTVAIISSCSFIVSSILLSLAILGVLIKTNFLITTLILLVLLVSYLFIFNLSKGGLYKHGETVRINEKKVISIVKESLDSIRDIIINNMYAGYISKYIKLDIELRKYQALATFIGQYPRYIIEALMISIMTSAAYFLKNQDGETDILPTLAIFSLGFLRLLPPMQTIYLNLSNIKSFSPALDALIGCIKEESNKKNYKLKGLKIKQTSLDKVGFPNSPLIELSNVSFKYPNSSSYTLKNIDLSFQRGKSYAIIGPSGSGKSTLQDIILGLLPPNEGGIFFKGIDLSLYKNKLLYHSFISHVPQTPLIINSSIRENLLFSNNEKINNSRLKKSLQSTELNTLINKQGEEFICGENGSKLSGGQKQRLAIARALYSDKDILFLDESTSALDLETEKIILNNIFENFKDKTIISITHKKNTLIYYDHVIDLLKLLS